MIRRLVCVLALVVSVGCGKDPVAPTPVFPNVVGGWSGTITTVVSVLGQNISNICLHSWTVTAQSGGVFSGVWQSSGGTIAACGQSGTFSGSVSTTGSVSSLAFNVSVGSTAGSGCAIVSGAEVFTGIVSGSSLSAQTPSQSVLCVVSGNSVLATRSVALSVQR